eukprot:TRINITY_DN4355_c0_g2_i1.p1 TRINITY_DN4355_c0_g2~~TRINITY_DN4355_c0_g2_i1.p1  ORF type:complete len:499 (+),score=180.73 TRINITY_DN4355_c0_g2_i1:48-1544(+)
MSKECLDSLNLWLDKKDKTGAVHGRCLNEIEDDFDILAEAKDDVPGLLGKGSFGVVRRFQKKNQPHLAHIPEGKLAIKEINKRRVCGSRKNLKWTMIEIAVLRGLKHEYLIQLYDVAHTEESVFLTMEMSEGGELFYFIASQKKLKPDVSSIILKQILKALAYCHAQGVVHRDVKPENVVINKDTLHVKLIDFGLAKYCGSTGPGNAGGIDIDFAMSPAPGSYGYSHEVQTPGGSQVPASPLVAATPCGTELYMALESIRGSLEGQKAAKWYSTRSRLPKIDVYAAGVIAYAMLTGRLPYRSIYKQARHPAEREKRLKDIESKMEDGFPFPHSAGVLPVEALDCVRDLMCHNPIERPTAAQALTREWLIGVKIPTSNPEQAQATEVGVQDKSKIQLKMPGRKSKPKIDPTPPSTTSMPPPVPKPPVPGAKGAAATPIVFVPDEEMKEDVVIADVANPEKMAKYKDRFRAMIKEVRQGEDDEDVDEDKDEGGEDKEVDH